MPLWLFVHVPGDDLVGRRGGFAGYWWFKGQVNRYTAEAPADLPIVELPEDEVKAIQERIDSFKETVEAGDTPDDLELTSDELNALISTNDEMRGKAYVKIEDGLVTGDVSIPTDAIPGGKGRYFNASATFDVSLENGVLIVTLADATVKGEPLPPQFIDGMKKENLAKEAYKDPEVAKLLRQFDSIAVEGDKIVLKPRVEEKAANDDPSAENTTAIESEEAASESSIETDSVDSGKATSAGSIE